MAVDIVTVPVGNPGNAGELSGAGAGGRGPNRICGAVDYQYNIGKYEVTAGQYTEFLKAVATTDSYGLYSTNMWSSDRGCKIQQIGLSGSYSYSVASDYADRPVNFVSWGDSARFANWLHNGQPTGAQDDSTTEDGAYDMSDTQAYYGPGGSIKDLFGLWDALNNISRESDWKWAITSEDEWYKAAYHKNDGVMGNYFDYSTSSDSQPSNDLIEPTDPGNNATFHHYGYTIGAPYYRTEVGGHENSGSPYGTFDQGGNVVEWTEAIVYGSDRSLRGGGYNYNVSHLPAWIRDNGYGPTGQSEDIGFRVAQVPEPATLSLLTLGGLAILRRRRTCGGRA